MSRMACFKAYDIRGRVPDELNSDIAFRLGIAYAKRFSAKRVALGRDIRHSSLPLLNALAHGLQSAGAEVFDLGLCGTEETYFAAMQTGVDGAIMVTASHNPMDYNGMKLSRAGAVPVSGDSGLRELEAAVSASTQIAPVGTAKMKTWNPRADYVRHLLGYVDVARLKPLRILVNPGNGPAGLVIQALQSQLPFQFIKLYDKPDGDFPNGIPNPMLVQNQGVTSQAVREHRCDFGVAWDGDFDRCFLFDETGAFIEGYYLVGLLAQALLRRQPGSKVIHDPRLTWNTIEIVKKNGGIPVQCKTGHAFIKERMRAENAVYGGEVSAHHYFREFGYCDNGNIPWLLAAALVSESGLPLSRLIGDRAAKYPVSGEINRKVADVKTVLARAEARYAGNAHQIDRTDGLSVEYADWRFNLRGSNTEPLIRLNVESRGDPALLKARTAELLSLIETS
ncbi:MAG: phosphomannomutase [Pseudomonadota bacterium]